MNTALAESHFRYKRNPLHGFIITYVRNGLFPSVAEFSPKCYITIVENAGRKTAYLHFIVIALVGIISYANTLDSPFFLDDKTNIVENPYVTGSRESAPAYFAGFFARRIMGYATFALNYKLGGLNVRGYHVVNILIHITTAILVYLLASLSLKALAMRGRAIPHSGLIPFFSALIFVSHPIQTQAVTYIVQRFASLATMFYVLSLVMYIKWRLRAEKGPTALFYVSSLMSAVLAMKTKEIAFTLPLAIAMYEFFFLEAALRKRLLYLSLVFLTIAVIPIGVAGISWSLAEMSGEARVATTMPRAEYLFTEFRVIATYIRLFFLPAGQNLDYDYPVYKSLLDPGVLFSLALILAIIGLAVWLFRRNRLASYGILWFFLGLSVESSVIPIADVIFEHRMYLPLVGASIAAAVGALWLFAKLIKNPPAWGAYALIASVTVALCATTVARNQTWRSEIILWEDVVSKSPNKARAHSNLGRAYENARMPAEAMGSFERALTLRPDDPKIMSNAGNAYMASGRYDEAIELYKKALSLNQMDADVHYNMGLAYWYKKEYDLSVSSYRIAASLKVNDARIRNNLGNAYMKKGMVDEAIAEYKAAIELNPLNARAHLNLGTALRAKGLDAEATLHTREAGRLNPALLLER